MQVAFAVLRTYVTPGVQGLEGQISLLYVFSLPFHYEMRATRPPTA